MDDSLDDCDLSSLSGTELAVLHALEDARGRVVGRRELARQAGLTAASERRCDSAIVAIRRALGPDAVVTVRKRGWRLTAPIEVPR